MEKMTGETLNITDENIKVIAEHFPEAMEEGKIKFDVLKELLGEFVDESNERYQFTWNGKSQSLKLSQTPSTGTLLPCKEKSKDWDTTENLYIEGDNLEVLKLLQKSYYKKIKMIYIDPPYNTGNDFVYKDDFKDNIKNYKEQTNQQNKANVETQGRYHTEWLNMMYPRLILAKALLTEDGLIFISIDENEYVNMRKMCDEIFGEMNFVASLKWKKKKQPSFLSKVATIMEYVLVYSKNYENIEKLSIEKLSDSDKPIVNAGNKESKIYFKEGLRCKTDSSINVIKKGIYQNKSMSVEFLNDIIIEDGRTQNSFEAISNFRTSQEQLNQFIEKDLVFITKNMGFRRDLTEEEKNSGKAITDLLLDWGQNQDGSEELKKLFNITDAIGIFDNPKPVLLIKNLIKTNVKNGDVILDFFSGSATTPHSIMQLEVEEEINLKYIAVQLDEITGEGSKAFSLGYKTICDIGEERIRRAGNKIKEETNADIDYGFKVFKLESSNLKLWNGEFTTEEEANNYFLQHLNPLVDGRTKEDLLYELLLKEGMPLTSHIEEIRVGDKTIYSIGMGYLMICLEDKIDMNIVEEIGKRKPESIIFRDSGFADENAKINTIQELKKYGIAEEVIKSI